MNEKICVIGLGYVGLPLARLINEKGLEVIGLDISSDAIEYAKKEGIAATTDAKQAIKDASIIVVCVPTPVDESYMPDLTPIEDTCKTISKNIKKGQTVIIESTIYPGVTEEVVKPILEESGLKAGEDFYLAHCPERIDPGNKKWDVGNIPRVIGGINKDSTMKASKFYSKIINAQILELSDVRSAEATKIVENAFRDINIAFVNELARSFDKMGIDVVEVIKAASTKPFGFMPHWPGCGVGGHCIPVDPYYLIEKAKKNGFSHSFLTLAREINNDMPNYTVELVAKALNEVGKSIKGSNICVLGVSYKKDVDDIRESPAQEIIAKLKKHGANVEVYDPFIPSESTLTNLDDCLNSECIVLVTDHTEFKKIEEKISNCKIKAVVDGRNFLDKDKIESIEIIYKGIGRGV